MRTPCATCDEVVVARKRVFGYECHAPDRPKHVAKRHGHEIIAAVLSVVALALLVVTVIRRYG